MDTLNKKFAILVLILLMLSIIDTLIMAITSPKNIFKAVAGEPAYVSGKLTAPVDENRVKYYRQMAGKNPNRTVFDEIITYAPQYDFFRIRFLEARGRLWRGVLESAKSAPQGDYDVSLFQETEGFDDKAPKFTIRLFQNQRDYRKSFSSFSQRYFGFAPFWISLVLFPLALYCIYITMRETGKELERLQAEGIGPIYKLAKQKTDWEVVFGLGSQHGVRPGDRLAVLNKHREPVGEIVATEVGVESTRTTYSLEDPIAPDHLIAIKPDEKEI